MGTRRGVLPFSVPVPLALASPVDQLPAEPGWEFTAKVDGWRALIITGPKPRIYSRHGTDLTRAFADIAEAARALPEAALDCELLAVLPDGSLSFGRLQSRAGKGPRAGEGFTVQAAVFDCLADGPTDLRPALLPDRRRHMLAVLESGPIPIQALPATSDPEAAMSWVGGLGGGVEGVVGKRIAAPYRAGRTSGWIKVRETWTLDAVIIGVTAARNPAQQALVLAMPTIGGKLRPVAVSLPIAPALRTELARLLHPLAGSMVDLPGTVGGLPGSAPTPYLRVEPTTVVEIESHQGAPEFGRLRHRPRVLRLRRDLAPADVRTLEHQ
ncbi:ATP-dependent DNA ligase [Kitasatospora aureofaciens]|uniref:ATP-dependent DNA ligase n=1 Tax=Kitasatospora aureofaciens TaxID=1894 RepID=UPI00340D29FB